MAPQPGHATGPPALLARTRITSPASSTSSMISADNPENTVRTSVATSVMTDRDTPAHSATTGTATEPLKLQSPASRFTEQQGESSADLSLVVIPVSRFGKRGADLVRFRRARWVERARAFAQ